MPYQRDESEIGSLWIKEGQKGDYMTGEILGQRVVCFRANKRSDKAPDWRVLKSRPRDEQRPSRVDDPEF
jgi:hypothetical protein